MSRGWQAERSPWRWPAAAAALVAAAAHVPITGEHVREAPYIGWSFVALEVTMTVLAVVLVLRDAPAVWLAAAVVPVSAMVAYAVTRSVALPLIGDEVGNWAEPLGLVALAAEALLVGIAAGRNAVGRREWLARRPVTWAAVVLVVGLLAAGRAAATGGG